MTKRRQNRTTQPSKRIKQQQEKPIHNEADQQDDNSSVTSHVSGSSSGSSSSSSSSSVSGSTRISKRTCHHCHHTCSQHPIYHHIPDKPCERSFGTKFSRHQYRHDHEMKWEGLHPYCNPECDSFWWVEQSTGEIITIYEIEEYEEKPSVQPATKEQIIQGKKMLEEKKRKQLGTSIKETSTKTSTSTPVSTPVSTLSTPLPISTSRKRGRRSHTNQKGKKRSKPTILLTPDAKPTGSNEMSMVETPAPAAGNRYRVSSAPLNIPTLISNSNSGSIPPQVSSSNLNFTYQPQTVPNHHFLPIPRHNPPMVSPTPIPFDMTSFHPTQYVFNGRATSPYPHSNNTTVGFVQVSPPAAVSHHHDHLPPATDLNDPLPSGNIFSSFDQWSVPDELDSPSSNSSNSIFSFDRQDSQDSFLVDMMRHSEMENLFTTKEDKQLND